MTAGVYRNEDMYREDQPKLINIKRNPYLVDYEQQRGLRNQRITQGEERAFQRRQSSRQRAHEIWEEQEPQRPRRVSQRASGPLYGQNYEDTHHVEPVRRRDVDQCAVEQAQRKRAAMERKRAAARRKRIVQMQRMVLLTGVFCIALLCGILFMKRMDAGAAAPERKPDVPQKVTGDILPASSSGLVQGLSATEYAKHPDWEENFLTPNEYSRPGEALEEVKNIFVHYTANPNTSAAQNRSYFEQLKDTHITSASAHFIIGYNGEILQCIPLDEIAYAVQTRNYDSISIECCYKSADGSFTQETYDSLIDLLAWLTDVYDLTTDDILRHYDCGGKKCPIYYTEHEDAWERLKKDVGESGSAL